MRIESYNWPALSGNRPISSLAALVRAAHRMPGKKIPPTHGKYLAIASMHLVPEVIDAKTWDSAAMFPDIGRAASAIWHPTEPWAIFGTFDGTLYRWHAHSPQALENLGLDHGAIIDWLAASPDGRLLASSDTNARFVIRRLSDNHVLVRGTGAVLRFAADSRRIAVADGDQLVVYSLRESPVYRQIIDSELPVCIDEDVHYRDDAAEFSPDGRLLVRTGLRGVRLFDAHTLQLVADLGLDHCGPAAFHPRGKLMTTFGYFSYAWNWPVTDNSVGPPVEVVPGATTPLRLAPQHGGRHAAWSANGQRLALADHRHNKVLLWDAATGAVRDFISVPNPIQVALSADGTWIAAQTQEPRTIVWNVESRQEVLNTFGHMGMSFSPDGKWFANREIPALHVYRVPSWELQHRIPVESALAQQRLPPVFQPAGNLLAVSDLDQRVRLFDRETGTDVATLADQDRGAITWLSFSPDGRRLAVARADRTAVWDLASLSRELKQVGLHVTGLPATSEDKSPADSIASTTPQVDRGSFPPADSWYTLWRHLWRKMKQRKATGRMPWTT